MERPPPIRKSAGLTAVIGLARTVFKTSWMRLIFARDHGPTFNAGFELERTGEKELTCASPKQKALRLEAQ